MPPSTTGRQEGMPRAVWTVSRCWTAQASRWAVRAALPYARPGQRADERRASPAAAARSDSERDSEVRVHDSPWKHLMDQLNSAGYESPDRVRRREQLAARGVAQPTIQQELLSEMADALKRAEDKLLDAIQVAEGARDAIPDAGAPGLEAALEAFREARARAERRKWELMVHRQALGLQWNQDVADLYVIPRRRP